MSPALQFQKLLPFLLRRPVADGLLSESELAEFRAEAIHFRAVRVILGEEAFLEEQDLVLGSGGVVDDGDEEALEVDLNAGAQLGVGVVGITLRLQRPEQAELPRQ